MKRMKFLALCLMMMAGAWMSNAYAAYGQLPDGGYWRYSDGSLGIDGATKVPDYGTAGDTPWWQYAQNIKTISFDSEIRVIGKNAFASLPNLEKVSIYNFEGKDFKVTLRERAFGNCPKLKEFEGWEYVGELDDEAFNYAGFTDRIELPYINTIKGEPFSNCEGLLRSPLDEDKMLYEPSIIITTTSSLYIDGTIAYFTETPSNNKKFVVMSRLDYKVYQWNEQGEDEIKKVRSRSYNKLVFGSADNWDFAFYRHRSWWYVDENDRMILNCGEDAMPTYKQDKAPWVDGRSSVKQLHVFNPSGSFTPYSFSKFTALTTVKIHPGSYSISTVEEGAFSGCSKLAIFDLDNMVNIGKNAFEGCAFVWLNIAKCKNISEGAFSNNKLLTLHLGDVVESIGSKAFYAGIQDNATIYIGRENPPTVSDNTFDGNNYGKIMLNIPEKYGDNYDKAPWNKFNRTAVGTRLYGYHKDNILYFFYDTKMVSRGGSQYWEAQQAPDWASEITQVMFDSSVDNARPTSTAYWFFGMENLEIFSNAKYLHTDNVTDMSSMFAWCSKLTYIPLKSWNTSKVTNMKGMFSACESLRTIDLNSFDMSKVTDASLMFSGCSVLRGIYCKNDWSKLSNLTKSSQMFYQCPKLIGGKGTSVDPTKVDKTFARPDGGPKSSSPGYFWLEDDHGYDPNEQPDPDPEIDPVRLEPITDCNVTSSGEFEFVQSLVMMEDNQTQVNLAFMTQDDWQIDWENEKQYFGSDGYQLLVEIEPENKADLRGNYSDSNEKLVTRNSGMIQVENQEISGMFYMEEGSSIDISLSEGGGSYDVRYILVLKNYKTDVTLNLTGNIIGVCADEVPMEEIHDPIDPWEEGKEPWGVDNVQSDKVQCTKVLREGKMYILRNNNIYNVQGALVK